MSLRAMATLRSIRPPPYVIPLDTPFSPESLQKISQLLPDDLLVDAKEGELRPGPHNKKTAAVLLALANVNDVPSVILEIRGKLRTHSGEISFPGGKVDPSDESFADAAIRETVEEIGVIPSQIQVLGRMTPTVKSLFGLDVHCFVGFISPASSEPSPSTSTSPPPNSTPSPPSSTPLPSLDLSTLTRSQTEVSQIFHVPLSHLTSPSRLREHRLPYRAPYWAIDVTDVIAKDTDAELPPPPWSGEDEVGSGGDPSEAKVEIWGLTGVYLNQFMRRLGAY